MEHRTKAMRFRPLKSGKADQSEKTEKKTCPDVLGAVPGATTVTTVTGAATYTAMAAAAGIMGHGFRPEQISGTGRKVATCRVSFATQRLRDARYKGGFQQARILVKVEDKRQIQPRNVVWYKSRSSPFVQRICIG
ncbi:hypothetical protein PCH_Pc19g00050 [Penicillium rubens Wisconsin 54-1255]|uniref:Uncharacterized protein n=1 Tax=Penicillium rubens (strain ATCC 28089 / DSM 1075 / NRRL 1951 / Wisconsin 54-1255) TaxID=500485 RepID=B6HD04_PENRW|nr:hypothetical protein PCH_Pc19g00050 [Penicillium rubens Wisconsin 54-1255]